MTIKVECASCGKILTAKDSAAGKRAKCTQCGEVVQIPEVYESEEVFSDDYGYDDGDDDGDDDYGYDDYGAQEKRKRKATRSRAPTSSYYSDDDTDLSVGEWVIAILCSVIGCIVGVVWMIQGKPKGSKMFGISILMQFFWGAVQVLMRQMANR